MRGKFLVAVGAITMALSGCTDPGWAFPTGYDAFTAPQAYDTSGANAFLNAAAVSLQSKKTDKAANLASMKAMVAGIMADHPDTDVIVFNELCTSWLYDDSDPAAYYASVAETVPGPSTAYVAGLAALENVAIAFGLAETDGSKFYNSQVLLKPDGTLVRYRKRGLNDGDKANGCTPGSGLSDYAEIRGIPVTLLICSDYQSDSVIKDISVSDARIVLASLVTATRLNIKVDFLARAVSKWVVYANGGGSQGPYAFPGYVFIADPTGTVHDVKTGPGAYSWMRIGVYK